MSVDKLAHVVWECKYHYVIVPKYRYKFFNDAVNIAVKEEFRKLCVWKQVVIIEGTICKDYIHMCLSIPPKYSVAEIIGTLKGKTAIRMFQKFPELKKQYWGSHFWSRGYYVSTVGRNEEMIRKYIKDQDNLDRLEDQEKLF